MMQYKGYTGKVEFDEEAGLFHGEVIDTKDVITFQAENAKELRKAFEESVDDYLEFCKERGEEPDKPFSGQFVVRISPELHREIYLRAEDTGKSINAWITNTLEREVRSERKVSEVKKASSRIEKGFNVKKAFKITHKSVRKNK